MWYVPAAVLTKATNSGAPLDIAFKSLIRASSIFGNSAVIVGTVEKVPSALAVLTSEKEENPSFKLKEN